MTICELPSWRPTKPYCMFKRLFTSKIYTDIVDIYGETVGAPDAGKHFRHYDVAGITERALCNSSNRADEIRFGSKFSVHGKLCIWNHWVGGEEVFYFTFDANDPVGVDMDEVYAVMDQFTLRVNEYLRTNGLAVQN